MGDVQAVRLGHREPARRLHRSGPAPDGLAGLPLTDLVLAHLVLSAPDAVLTGLAVPAAAHPALHHPEPPGRPAHRHPAHRGAPAQPLPGDGLHPLHGPARPVPVAHAAVPHVRRVRPAVPERRGLVRGGRPAGAGVAVPLRRPEAYAHEAAMSELPGGRDPRILGDPPAIKALPVIASRLPGPPTVGVGPLHGGSLAPYADGFPTVEIIRVRPRTRRRGRCPEGTGPSRPAHSAVTVTRPCSGSDPCRRPPARSAGRRAGPTSPRRGR